MTNALDYSAVYASYPSVNPTTELYMPSNSLAFTRDGNHFVAGSINEIAIFDTWRNGEGPIVKHKTADSRKARKLYGSASMSCKGRVSALAISGDGILAAGSTEREIALYDHEGD
ncbi:hypothetical protein KC318_g15149, partial [Hortaea werneckii]